MFVEKWKGAALWLFLLGSRKVAQHSRVWGFQKLLKEIVPRSLYYRRCPKIPTPAQGPKWEKEEGDGDLAHIERARGSGSDRVLMVNPSFLNRQMEMGVWRQTFLLICVWSRASVSRKTRILLYDGVSVVLTLSSYFHIHGRCSVQQKYSVQMASERNGLVWIMFACMLYINTVHRSLRL